jgi:hypothetical protein
MRVTVLFCFFVLLVLGCDPMAFRSVSLHFPPEVRSTVSVSTEQPDVQEALRLVDTVATPGGLVRIAALSSTNEQGLLVAYDTPTGLKNPMIECRVFFKDNTLDILFSEFGKLNSSRPVKAMCNLLYDRLSSRYGTERVKIGR